MNTNPAVTDIQNALADYGEHAISLLIGEPYFGPGESLRYSLARAVSEGSHRYSDPQGSPNLRSLICEKERGRQDGCGYHFVIGNGSKSLLYGLLGLLGRKGVLVPTPAYPAMLIQPRLQATTVKTIRTDSKTYKVSPHDLAKQDMSGCCLVLGSPANPTGAVYSETEQRELVDWCRNAETSLIADEVYIDLAFQPDYSGFAGADPQLSTVSIVRSFSKSHGVCGWRLGYAICSSETARRLAAWQGAALNPPSTLVQRAFELAGVDPEGNLEEIRAYYKETARLVGSVLEDIGLRVILPQGGYYIFADARDCLEDKAFAGTADLCRELAARKGIGLWPGEDFGCPGWLRASFGAIKPSDRDSTLLSLEEQLRSFFPNRCR